MKDVREVLMNFDLAYSGCFERNARVVEDIRFAKNAGAQWEGADAKNYANKPMPEFNKVARSVNRILGQFMSMEMNAKIITASDDATDEDAELLQGRWRNDFNNSDGSEAIHVAADEAFHGGFGALKVVSRYDDEENADSDFQHLELEPIRGAASSVVFGAGAIEKTKRDAKQAWQLVRMNRKDVEEEYGEIATFPAPIEGYVYDFDWCLEDGNKDIYLAHYYEIVDRKLREYHLEVPFYDEESGVTVSTIIKEGRTYTDQDGEKLDADIARIIIDSAEYDEVSRTVKCVEYALMCGNRYLTKPRRLPFKTIPIIPMYGYHWVINGIEHYCGEVSRQKDAQRFENMMMSSLMEIASAPQVEKPYFTPDQIAGHEQEHADMATEDYAYLLLNPIEDSNGNVIPTGPIGKYMPPQVGTGLQAGLMKVDQMQKELGGTGQSTLPSNASGQAVQAINQRQDDSYQPMIQNAMQSLRVACECWIPAAKELYFKSPRSLRIMAIDGSFSRVQTMQIDASQDGSVGYNKNTGRGQYDVIVKMGESYKSRKEAERQTALEMAQFAGSDTEMGQLLLLNAMMNTTGDGSLEMRKIAAYRSADIMIGMGIPEQEILDSVHGDEMKQHVMQKIEQSKQAQAMNAQMMQQQQMAMLQAQLQQMQGEGQARMMEGRAALMNEQNDAVSNEIKMIDAETKRLDVIAKAQAAGYKLDMEQAKMIAEVFDKIEQGNREKDLAMMDRQRMM